jgi:uncharacterized membrane protein YfcA
VPVPLATIALLALAAFAAGVVDAIGGGGGLVTVPALLAANLPPHLALGTNKGQAIFGAVSSAVTYARRGYMDRARALPGFACGFLGALAGAAAQLAIDPAVLRPVVIGLLVVAAGLVAWPRKMNERRSPIRHAAAIGAVVALVIGAYDGFFGPGTGTMLLVAYVALYADTLTHASGNAKAVNLASNCASFVLFAWRGTILWSVALPMAAANALGAYVGVHLAVRRGDRFVRVVVLGVVALVVGKLLHDLHAL